MVKKKLTVILDSKEIDDLLEYLNKRKILFTNTELNSINKNVISQLYSFKENINYHLVKYNQTITKKSSKSKKSNKKSKKKSKRKSSFINNNSILSKINKVKGYHYNELDDLQGTHILGFKVRESLLNNMNETKIPHSVKKVSEGFARGVAQYVLINFKLPHKTSNAYIKLWELYASVPQLLPNKKQLNIFHLAEAPGQWINCTRHYIETKRHKVEHYNWIANSLNPTHPSNVAKYGKHIFADDYGFLKKYPQKWLFGEDDTGDITSGKNVKWFKEYMNEFKAKSGGEGLHLITGDAGMGSGSGIKLVDLQKIDYAQMCMVAACSTKGTNCVIKHFNYLNMDFKKSFESSGFFISYLYIYYLMFDSVRLIKPNTSSPNSGEFYLVGLRFTGIEDNVLDTLIKELDTFKENQCFFKKEEIPEAFTSQVVEFVEKLLELNNKQFDIVNMLLTCIVDKDGEKKANKEDKNKGNAKECKKYLDKEFITKIQTKRYKEWIKTYRFE